MLELLPGLLLVLLFFTSSSPPAAGLTDAQIRVAGSGSTLCSGRVEILYDGVWGTVCDDDWDMNDAKVACRQLGCGTAQSVHHSAHFGQGTGQIWLDDVNCYGTERSLTECQHRGFRRHNCNHGEDAGVVCSDLQIRLAGTGSSVCSGRVEIYHNNTWGTVCDDSWDMNDAKVVCRQLGCGSALSAPPLAHFGPGTETIWLDELACSGSESSLTACQHGKFGVHNCGHGEDAGVICSDGMVKLVGSNFTNCAGRVEIFNSDAWGTVCDDSWDMNDAEVVCRQLGCGSPLAAPQSARFGQGSGQIWLDDISCSGRERFLTECQNGGLGKHNCNHGEDAGVVCSETFPKPRISMNPSDEVTLGENIEFTCTVSSVHFNRTFILQQTSGSFTKVQTSNTNYVSFSIPKVSLDNEGLYQCQYQTRLFNQDFKSTLSDSVRLSITVSLPTPSISMSPAGEVTWGQDVSITCSISTHHLGGTFILETTSGSFRKTQTSGTTSATFSISKVDFDNEGSYRCQYVRRVPNGDLSSPLSDSGRLSVTVPLQQPGISVTSPNGGLVWSPEGAEITRGYSFVITCVISSNYPRGFFSLMFSGSNIPITKPADNHSASFNFPEAKYVHQGDYSCVYEVTLSSRKFTSVKTAVMCVTVKVPVSLVVCSVLVFLLLLVVFLVGYLVLWKRQEANQPQAIVQTELTLGDRCTVTEKQEEEVKEEKEEEQRYVD